MTKKDYEKIAKSINEAYTPYMRQHHKYAIETIALELAHTFKDENPRFDPSKFLKACGVKE